MNGSALRAAALLVAPFLVAGCAREPLRSEPGQALRFEDSAVEFGRAVAVTATRRWGLEWAPEDWPADPFPGWRARETGTSRREDGLVAEETRRWVLRAFALDAEAEIVLPAWTLRSRDASGAAPRTIAPASARIRVLPAVDPSAPGELELPDALSSAGIAPGVLAVLLAAAAAGAALAWRTGRPSSSTDARAAPAEPPDEARASDALRALRAAHAAGALDDERFHQRLAEVLRAAAAERGVANPETRTREELLAAWRAAGAPRSEDLERVFGACDASKFGRARSAETEREQRLAASAVLIGGEAA